MWISGYGNLDGAIGIDHQKQYTSQGFVSITMADFSSTTWDVNYESKKYSVNTTTSGSFSITKQGTERTIIRSPSGREFLTSQGTLKGRKSQQNSCLRFHLTTRKHLKTDGKIRRKVIENNRSQRISDGLVLLIQSVGNRNHVGYPSIFLTDF